MRHIDYCVQKVESFHVRTVGVAGLTFKEGTDDLRFSPGLDLVKRLKAKGYTVFVYDDNICRVLQEGVHSNHLLDSNPDINAMITPSLQSLSDRSELIVLNHQCYNAGAHQEFFKNKTVYRAYQEDTNMYGTVSLVIAAYNSGKILAETLKENLKLRIDRIIIVDGMSTDTTADVVQYYKNLFPEKIELHIIPKKGLANARNYGTGVAHTEYILHAGPDNVLSQETVNVLLQELEIYDLVSCQTRLRHPKHYLEKVDNIYKKRFSPGIKEVVGTPYMARKELFDRFPFDEQMINSDDTEICHRLKMHGKKIYRSPAVCYETGFGSFQGLCERWPRWGRGDALFYAKMKKEWTMPRRLKSYLHPFVAEIIEPRQVMSLKEFFFSAPVLILSCMLRYYGWFRYIVTGR